MIISVTMNSCGRCVLLLVSALVLSEPTTAQTEDPVEATTTIGKITGYRYRYEIDTSGVRFNKTINTFLGVPYAEPPIGDLRFRKPVPKHPWEGSLNCTKDGAMCWQFPIPDLPLVPPQDEDCLFLNIWSPDIDEPASGLPVMVFIHGGAFVLGSGSGPYYDGLPLAGFNDVVTITLNYRLTVFGFLFANDASPGNYGLFDQSLALRWIKDNIHAFGGDPDRITIFGQSAGGASVGHQLLAEQSRDLFNQAILMSGTMLNPWAIEENKTKALTESYQVGEAAGCTETASDEEFVACLRERPATVIVAAAVATFFRVLSVNIPFAPVVDDDFIRGTPLTLMEQGRFKQCDIMTGSTKDDGEIFAAVLPFRRQFRTEEPFVNYTEFQRLLRDETFTYFTPEVTKALEQEYIDWSVADDPETNFFDTYIDLLTDEAFGCPCDLTSRHFTERGNKVYRWLFNHVPSRSFYSLIPGIPPDNAIWKWKGVGHAEDVPFFLGIPFFPNWHHNYTEEEKHLSIDMMRYLSNFAKTGDPNLGSDEQSTEWEEFDSQSLKLMELKPNQTVIENYHTSHCHFLNDYVLKLITFTAGLDKVQAEWDAEFGRWKDYDVTHWRTEFEEYQDETEEFCQNL